MRTSCAAENEEQTFFRITNGCKINLFLRITGKRTDGYHELESLFLPLPQPSDTLEIALLPAHACMGGLRVSCDVPGIDPENNTLTKTYARYASATGFAPSLHVRLHKGVPHGAGLGGGSANSASFLLFLQNFAARNGYAPLDEAPLALLAANIGADVPFFLLNRPALAGGIGEKLTAVKNPCGGMHLVLVCPEQTVSTAWAFARLDEERAKNRKNGYDGLTEAALRDTRPIFHGMFLENDFEEVVFQTFPQLFQIWNELRALGANIARLSGTGSSLFGLFQDEGAAVKAVNSLRSKGFRVYMHAV